VNIELGLKALKRLEGNSYTIKLFDNGQTTFTKALSFALHEQERSE